MDATTSRLLERRKSYDRIARFFSPKSEGTDRPETTQTSRALCRQRALERVDQLRLTSLELERVTRTICRHAYAPKLTKLQTILMDKTTLPSKVVCVDRLLRDHMTLQLSYEDWQEIFSSMGSEKVRQMLSPSVFLMLPPDDQGCVNGLAVLEYLHELHRSLTATRFLLAQPEGTIDGMLNESELTAIVQRKLDETIRGQKLVGVDIEFQPYYELICTRLLVLRHDFYGPHAIVSIDDLVACPVFQEWFQLMDHELHGLFVSHQNRFTEDSIRTVHRQYIQLDRDKNGLLSANEMLDYGKKRAFNPVALTPTHDLTQTFVAQVFHELPTFPPENELDYKMYVDFTLRMSDRHSLASLRFFWSLLDIQKQGFLDAFTVDFFVRDLVTHMRPRGRDDEASESDDEPIAAAVTRIRTQVFDLVAPRDPARITWRDLTQCRLGHLVVRMLTDTVAYRAYEACDGRFAMT